MLSNNCSVVDADPQYSAGYHGLGLVYDKQNNYEEAIKYFNKAIELEDSNAVYWHNRGCCFRNMGKYF